MTFFTSVSLAELVTGQDMTDHPKLLASAAMGHFTCQTLILTTELQEQSIKMTQTTKMQQINVTHYTHLQPCIDRQKSSST